MAYLEASGKLTFLRVNDVGTGFGPDLDHIDVEVIMKLGSEPNRAMGFRLRNDGNRPARQGMLDLLRDAFSHNWNVVVDYELDEGKQNGIADRVALTK
jgi:hypothetical protein